MRWIAAARHAQPMHSIESACKRRAEAIRMGKKRKLHPAMVFTVQLQSGHTGVAFATTDGWLTVQSIHGTKRAAIQATPVEALAKTLLAELEAQARARR
jgi:hypothetical protein